MRRRAACVANLRQTAPAVFFCVGFVEELRVVRFALSHCCFLLFAIFVHDCTRRCDNQNSVKNCFIRGSVVRYVQIPKSEVDTELLQDSTRIEAREQKKAAEMQDAARAAGVSVAQVAAAAAAAATATTTK